MISVIVLGLFTPVHAQTYNEFGIQFHPQKLLENTEGIMHVYVLNEDRMSPTTINGLKVSSSDNSILEIKDMVKTENFTTEVKIFAKKPGTANISLAAPGIKSKEVPITEKFSLPVSGAVILNPSTGGFFITVGISL